jgi:hypothetical protein
MAKSLPLLLTCFLVAWTAIVYPFSKYGDRWAMYPALIVFPATILVHAWLSAVSRPRTQTLLYALLHIPVQFFIWMGCLMLISKDSL